MKKNPLLTWLFAVSAILHVVLLTRIAMPKADNAQHLTVRYETAPVERVKMRSPRLPDPPAPVPIQQKPVPQPERLPAPEPRTTQVKPREKPEQQSAPLPAPPPNPIAENTIVPEDSTLQTVAVNPSAPRGLSRYDTTTEAGASKFWSKYGVIGGTGTKTRKTGGQPQSTLVAARPPAVKIAEPPPVDRVALLREYAATIKPMIENKKKYPEKARRNDIEGEVRVRFIVARDGTIKDISLNTSSGTSILDNAALKAVRDAAPFPPLPSGLQTGVSELIVKLIYSYE